jgi:hypothetical protein
MKRFRDFIKEESEIAMADLDIEFMRRATRVTSFSLTPSDFTSIKYKREIQSLYQQYIFKSFNPDNTLTALNQKDYNTLVRKLKSDDRMQYEKLHNLPLKGVGPGETVLFLLTKWPNGTVGGGASAGVDFTLGSKKYEVKGVKWKSKSSKDYVSDFRLGGNITGMTQLESEIQRAFYKKGYTNTPGAAEIKGSLFQQFEREHPAEYAAFEKRYQNLAKNYFADHDVIFIQTEQNQPDFGEILAIKRVKAEDIRMERYTSRSIKPLVNVKTP